MNNKNLANFLFEVGTLRKINRAHAQTLLTNDLTDNIASHSYRVSVIGLFLAYKEECDPGLVVIMCLTHDWPETRSGDHNWVHKKNVAVDTKGIIEGQSEVHGINELSEIIEEYEARQSKESIIAKDADTLDQLLLLKEYEWQGNMEASSWLNGRSKERPYAWVDRLKLKSAKELARTIYDSNPSNWWRDLYTNVNLDFKPNG